jgi:dihydrodipicolinate synthase/N-acetylneuraminate lyase
MFEIKELAGVIPALVSPLDETGAVDEAAIPRLVDHVLNGGVHGLLALGSTGETASLDESSRRKVLAGVVKAAAGRVPVLCGVAQSHLAASRGEIEAAARLGADGVLVAPPFYYPMDQPTVLAYYRQLAPASPLPILLYHIPMFTKVVTEPATVAILAREGTIAGIKDSSRDFEYFEGVCIATRGLPDFRIFTGSDTMLLPSMAMGGAGTICGGANVAPDWVVRIYNEYRRGDLAAARTSQDALYELVQAVRAGVFPSAIKAALHMQGICQPWTAPPVQQLDGSLNARLREKLEAWSLLTPAAAARRPAI